MLVTQRVDVVPGRGERRDALDQRMVRFLAACGFLAAPVPNDVRVALALWRALAPAGLVLSGGNDLAALGGDAPERDETEAALTEAALAAGCPVLGVCRGMQFLLARDAATLTAVDGHAGTRHRLVGAVEREVNSFHRYGVSDPGPAWRILATAPDGKAELVRRRHAPLWGMLWHPEREDPFHPEDLALVRAVLEGRSRL
ncbi:gamma-glutamyl-gamma-aminobutyrate hydrolase family protein [Fundidesulfovibrio butyratiphilus]